MTQPLRLVLFDIDGTLTHSQSIDSGLYLRSLAEVFGFTEINPDWSSYRHTTDSGILAELFQARRGRAPTRREAEVFRAHFVAAVSEAAARAPFRQIAGARALLDHLKAAPDHGLGLATGGYSESARCKLQSAGLDYDEFPAASSDDATSRVAIMKVAIERVLAHRGASLAGRRPHSIVYVGDAIWDARACRELAIPFIGVSAETSGTALRSAGAAEVFPDFRDVQAFCGALDSITARGA